jgi:hypothetical protein
MAATNQKIRRLPGFHFEARASTREDILPRMDIALFVGFAASGPIGIPVVLETAEQFDTIFGKNLALVWNKEKGETVYAYLAPAVQSFFRNGGKRCWVIRTARLKPNATEFLNRACYNFFPLSGLACVHFDKTEPENITPVFARARAKGSWSDDLQIGTVVLSRTVKFLSLDDLGGQKIVRLEVSANEPVKTGELLRLNFLKEGLSLLLTADEIEDGAKDYSPQISTPVGKRIVKVISKRFIWLENLTGIASPNAVQNVSVSMWTHRNALNSQDISKTFFVQRQAELSIEPQKTEAIEKVPPKVKLKFTNLPPAKAPLTGTLLITNFENKSLFLQVETVNISDSKTQKNVEVTCLAIFCGKNVVNPASTPQAERLALELWIKKDEKSFIKLSDLAFDSVHERFWGNLPTDDDLYRFPESREKDAPEIPSWTQAGESANLPIAGNGDRKGFYFPIFPAAFPENYLGCLRLPGTKLQRDGLEVFEAGLFLDEKLKNTGLNNLLSEAEFIRYLSPTPRPLQGIHSALAAETTIAAASENSSLNAAYISLSLDEATIISVPDALHRGWYQEKNDELVITSPPLISSPPVRPDWWHFQDCRTPDVKRVSQPLWGNFLDCAIRIIEPPMNLSVLEEKISGGNFTLVWTNSEVIASPSEDEFPRFVLEESAAANFQYSQKIYDKKEPQFDISGRGAGIYYYRVRTEISAAEVSDWSIGLAVKVQAAENWVVNTADRYDSDVLFAVQRALLRMCAARGDIFAVLDLPEHYDKNKALAHVATLKTTKGFTSASLGVEPFSADETKALSFGAVYHPWLMTREGSFESLRNIPPGGAACGVMARRTIERGAWIAPANEPLQDILGLATDFERESFLDFQDGLINLVRQEPTGFLVLDSDTLSVDFDLRPINVRRLLSLLRRVAAKRGAEYVFEPNDERFRRQVQRGFASLLDLMFARGAFAGATPATSYQVVVGESVNNFQSVEQGRFIVELRVAPSQPLKFVSVRLVQAGGRSSVSETI